MCLCVQVSSEEEVGTRSQEGLIRGYTYPVTAVKRVQVGETSLLSSQLAAGALSTLLVNCDIADSRVYIFEKRWVDGGYRATDCCTQ
uniref:(California timema) hypothetical protein n=1 Tax=Timema californicum TaxID=61474 RepID=A0A7R9PC86_TIMCA|nr:unnamed protein product [Timema californicum]